MGISNEEYANLVASRRTCEQCLKIPIFDKTGEPKYYRNQKSFDPAIKDEDHIGNFSTWAHDLNARIVIVGQDYADIGTYERDKGRVQTESIKDQHNRKEYSTETNLRLWQLVQLLGIDIGSPYEQRNDSGVFLTNAVLCLKPGTMSSPNPEQVYHNCSVALLGPLIKQIEPKAVIALGKHATRSVLFAYSEKDSTLGQKVEEPFRDLFKTREIPLSRDTFLYPVYHPGSFGRMNRRMIDSEKENGAVLQQRDWSYISKRLLERSV